MSGGVSAACPPTPQAQTATARVHADQSKALDVMKKMVTGEVSGSEGMKQLRDLVVDQAKAVGVLPESAGASDKGGGATGYSMKDSFDAGGAAKPKMMLNPDVAPVAKDLSFLDKDSGGGSKPGIGSGSN